MIICYVVDELYVNLLKKSIRSYKKYNPTAKFVVVSERPIEVDGVENFVMDIGQHRGLTRISNAAYLKLYLTRLPYDKVLYVDCDTICQYPLNDLWNMDCPKICICESHIFGKRQAISLGLEKYGLAAVILMNLKELRKCNFTERCLEVEKKLPTPDSGWFHDETCINVALRGELKFVDVKWDYCHKRDYQERAILERDAKILHFIGKDKTEMSKFKFYSNIPNILNYIRGKNVAIVGNAKSIFEKNNGKNIDKADVVIRFNKGFPKNKKSQGTKTNIVILALTLEQDEVDSYGADIVINRSTFYKNKTPYVIQCYDRMVLRDKIGT